MSTNISTWIANAFRRSTHSFLMAGVELSPMDAQRPLIHFRYRQWCNFSGIEAVDFSCIYTRVIHAEVFLAIANTRTKSIQKQIKGIDVDKVESKKPLASKSCFL